MTREPPLHQAILNDDEATIQSVASDPHLLHRRNALGFTPLELASFLGKENCVQILGGCHPLKIGIIKKGSSVREYLSETEFMSFFGVKYRRHLTFADYAFFQQVLKNCPWTLQSSVLGADNRALSLQYQLELASGAVADVTIQWIDDILGYGLFANQDFPTGTYIGEFTGRLRRLYRARSDANSYCFHYPTRFWSWNYMTVDALLEGNETRFINHNDTPNLEPLCASDRGLNHIIFVTSKLVQAGEQLTYNYGKDFWRNRNLLLNTCLSA